MEVINLILHLISIISLIALTHAIREMYEIVKLMMYENDIPEDLRRYINEKGGE